MRFSVLGQVAAWHESGTIQIERPRQRAVLAYLLLSPNRAVPISELVEAIWAGAKPATARSQIQADISAIRRCLRHPDSPLPCGGPTGYLLPVGEGQLDLTDFNERVRRAEGLVGRERLDEAARHLRDALGLWRGEPLADARAAFVEGARARLTEQRLTALESLAELELAAGRHHELAVELAALVGAHPIRERFVSPLMLALYRCGRIEEALGISRLFRQRLAEEHGLDPSKRHEELTQAILRRDPALDLQRARTVTVLGSRPAPAQLPAGALEFTGRTAVLNDLHALLGDSPGRSSALIVALDGMAGVGKTSLALHWAREVGHRYPDGQFYLNLRGHSVEAPLAPHDALAQLLRSLGLAPQQVPTDVAEAAALYRSMLATGRFLILLDNAASAESVRPLLPGSAGCLAIVTSRRLLGGLAVRDGAHTMSLSVLARDESIRLLSRVIGANRIHAEPAATDELAAYCGDLPLALCIAAARIREPSATTIAGYVAQLRADRLSALAIPDDDATTLRSAFALSYQALEAEPAGLFRLLGLIPGADFQAEAAAALTGLPGSVSQQLLARLVGAHLVEVLDDKRYTLHDLLRDYARELACTEPTGAAATSRLYGWYVETARAAARLTYPHLTRLPDEPTAITGLSFQNSKEANAWLDAEYPNLVQAIQQGPHRGQRSSVWRLADAIRGYLLRRSYLPEWLMIAETALAAARADGDDQAQLALHLSLSLAHRNHCDYPRTIGHLEQAQALAVTSGWDDGELTVLGNLAGAYFDIGRLAEAESLFRRALTTSRRLDRPGNVAANLTNLAATLRDLGNLTEALPLARDAVEAFRTVGSPNGEADALDNLGQVLHQLGMLSDALEVLCTAAAAYREQGDERSEASALTNYAAALGDAGRLDEAREAVVRAVDLAADSGSARTEAEALNAAAFIFIACGQPQEALRLAKRAQQLALEIGVRQPEIASLVAQAAAHHHLGTVDVSAALARQALEVASSHGFAMLASRATALLR